MAALLTILLGLFCLVAFNAAMPQESKYVRTVPILGRHKNAPRIRTTPVSVIPEVPTLEEATTPEVITENTPGPVILANTDNVVKKEDVKESAPVPRRRTKDEEEALFKKQAESAKYKFESHVDDGINGISQSRSEIRDGLKLNGMYSFSDGFFNRTVFYEADENGYRIVKEENIPIGDGPTINPDGEAFVRSSLGSNYKITLDDYQKPREENEETFEERSDVRFGERSEEGFEYEEEEQ